MNPVVEIRNVHKVYTRGSEKLDVLQGVTVHVAPGEFLALTVPSGSGKTTLLIEGHRVRGRGRADSARRRHRDSR